MMAPLYRGLPIFGVGCRICTIDLPRGGIAVATFGRDGLEPGPDGGARGRITTITGTLSGLGPTGLAAAEAEIRSCNDGQLGDLVDDMGVTWANVMLKDFKPSGRASQDQYGMWLRSHTTTLFHLS